jgi:hypothetical protein
VFGALLDEKVGTVEKREAEAVFFMRGVGF